MAKLNEVYKCEICGNIIEVNHEGGGELSCCGEPMKLLQENTTDGAIEKHVPVVKITKSKIKVKIGSIPHPMEDKHYIEWIELIADGVSYKKFLKPGEKPQAEFLIKILENSKITVKEYCNLHGLWKN